MAFYSNDEFRENSAATPGAGTPVLNMYSDGPFPKLLYRLTGDVRPRDDDGAQAYERNLIGGLPLETRMVHSEAEVAALSDDGWRESVAACRVDLDTITADEPIRRGPGRPRREALAA